MRSALVTGCAGYVGSVLVRRLLDAGVRVTGIDDLSRGTRGHLRRAFGHPGFVFIVGDIRRAEDLARAAGEGADVVFHLAARHFIPECVADPAGTVELNVLGTQRVWQAGLEAGASRFVLVSTADVYRPSAQPHRETDPTEPFNIYGISKLCAEQLLRLQARAGGPRLVVARLFNVIGPGDTNPHLVPEITRQVLAGAGRLELGNLWPVRDYVCVGDAAEALHRLATLAEPPDTVNVGSGVGWTVADVVRCLGEILGRSLEIVSVPERCRPVERDALVADPGLLVAATGWKPAAELRLAVEEIAAECATAPFPHVPWVLDASGHPRLGPCSALGVMPSLRRPPRVPNSCKRGNHMISGRVADLAIFGGPPLFSEPLHVGRPNIGDRNRLLARFTDVLDRRWLTNHGPYVQEFEQRLAERVGVRHCIATCNATVALEIAVKALGLHGEVILPSFTFVATAHALQWQGIRPVFCDIDPLTCNLDPHLVETLITPCTTGILGVHLWGRPCNVDRLAAIAHRHRLRLLYDAAHAFGCSHNGRMIGNFGDAEVFSFHATKFLNSFEGGAIATNNAALAHDLRLMINFGFAGYDNVVSIGLNGKMTEVAGLMGLTSLEAMGDLIAVNRSHYRAYRAGLAAIPGITLLRYDEAERCNYQYIVVQVNPAHAGLTRDALVQILTAENVLARRYFHPGCHRMEPYRSLYPDAGRSLPHTEHLAASVLSLPTGTAVTPADIDRICSLISFVVHHAPAVRARMEGGPSVDSR